MTYEPEPQKPGGSLYHKQCPKCGRWLWNSRRRSAPGFARHKMIPPTEFKGHPIKNPWCNWIPWQTPTEPAHMTDLTPETHWQWRALSSGTSPKYVTAWENVGETPFTRFQHAMWQLEFRRKPLLRFLVYDRYGNTRTVEAYSADEAKTKSGLAMVLGTVALLPPPGTPGLDT